MEEIFLVYYHNFLVVSVLEVSDDDIVLYESSIVITVPVQAISVEIEIFRVVLR